MHKLLKEQIINGANAPGFQSGRFRFHDLMNVVEELDKLETENARLRVAGKGLFSLAKRLRMGGSTDDEELERLMSHWLEATDETA